ncbi:sec-independent protein translocase protein TatA [Arenibacter nanhaiticus]|uniref:Sec-independent protein translocase protein TatA n=1 Tax=Arenibacter nanhaiticus TaxID=558155 RepID=A0A1M6H634_9FLAO|nr:twin-arginine translocase TatA/TatE family subunit [Arenibacter nanhaiticus]SHJ17641.1 sec-independent protein translocase protein TatA [Arenibacter nanhaiticus]
MFSTIILFISGAEIFFIMFIVVMVFGADKIPDIAKGLGKGMRQLRDATDDIKQEIQKSAEKQGIDTSFTNDIRNEIDKVKESVDDVSGVVKRK